MMYEELIKRLRDIARSDGNIKSNYIGLSLLQAADAIEELDKLLDGVSADNDSLCEKIERMQQPRWIPVTERLPEICERDVNGNITFSEKVWVCQKYGDGFVWQTTDQYTTNNGGGWLSEIPFDDPTECCKVIAWMPLPEPYEVK